MIDDDDDNGMPKVLKIFPVEGLVENNKAADQVEVH